MSLENTLPRRVGVGCIKAYRKATYPVYNFLGIHMCKFEPSCSEYTLQAIEEYGLIKGSVMGFNRIMRCNPFNKGGYDPVKKKE